MIVSFRGKAVEDVAAGKTPKGFPASLVASAERRLRAIANAVGLNDLRSPPGNRLEALHGNRKGAAFDTHKRSMAHLLSLDGCRRRKR